MYFTVTNISSTELNGGAICCRNHIKRLSEDGGIDLFVVLSGNQEQEESSISYLDSIGVKGIFISFKKPEQNQKTKRSFFQRFASFHWEEIAHDQTHVDSAVVEAISSHKADMLLIDYFYSALFCRKALRISPRNALITFNREVEFYLDWIKATTLKGAKPFSKAISTIRLWFNERSIYKRMNTVIALSPPDMPKHKGTYVTPYLDPRPVQWKPNSSQTIFFVGNIEHFPNRSAIEYIITKLAPAVTSVLPSARFKIIGALPKDLSFHHPSVDLLGRSSPEEVEQQFLNCQIFICPIKNTFGMKFKIAEALSYGTPFLASPESMLSIPHIRNQPVISLLNPEKAAKAIIDVISSKESTMELANKINFQHRKFIKAQFNIWSRSLKINL